MSFRAHILNKHSVEERKVTVRIFLGDAVGPDEGGQAADVPLEDALVDGEVPAVAAQDDRVLVGVAAAGRVAVDVVGVELLLLPRRGFQESLVRSEVVAGPVRDGPVRGLLVGVHDLLIFVGFGVFLSHGAYLLARHRDQSNATWLSHRRPPATAIEKKARIKKRLCIDGQV